MATHIFRRKIYEQMLRWKERRGSTALLIEGARRIGKSTIAEQFAKNEYESYILVDFTNCDREVIELFDDVRDLNFLFLRLQSIYGVSLIKGRSLIILDEIQFAPKARQAIKHLVADGRYHYIETGSLISIRKNTQGILIPSEETRVEMHPMDFEEFLWATGKAPSVDLIRHSLENLRPLGDDTVRRLMRDMRLYMLIGGMPQAVASYLDTNNFIEVDQVKRDILSLYEEDLLKVDPTGRLSQIFNSIPSQLQKKADSFRVKDAIGRVRDTKAEELISELAATKTVNLCYRTLDPETGLAYGYDMLKYKMYMGDTGLFVTQIFRNTTSPDENPYNRLLANRLQANLGYLYENVVAQMLAAGGDKLSYYTFSDKESKKSYEIDFLIARQGKVCPIEVKSSAYRRHTSLDLFCEKFQRSIFQAYVLTTRDIIDEGEKLKYLPVFMTPWL